MYFKTVYVVSVIDNHCMKENKQKWKTVTKNQFDGVPTSLWSSAMCLSTQTNYLVYSAMRYSALNSAAASLK